MISAQNILEELSIVKSDVGPLYISVDPSSLSSLLRDLKDEIRSVDFRKEKTFRFFLDLRKDEFLVWMAYRATHGSVIDDFGEVGIAGLLYLDTKKVVLYCKGLDVLVWDMEKVKIGVAFDNFCRIIKGFFIDGGAEVLGAALHRFVKRGDLERVKDIVELLKDSQLPNNFINYSDPYGKTPYYVALKIGDQKIASYLKSVGGNLGFYKEVA
jgi:hypothetical protein